jgi:FlgD Ig-like domain
MKKHLFGAALIVCLVTLSGMALAQTIDDVQSYDPLTGTGNSPYDGQTVTLSGAIYVVKGTFNGGTHYFKDGTGGISFYDSGAIGLDYGTEIEVTGTVGLYGSEYQLNGTTITVTGSGPDPTPLSALPEEVLYDYEYVGDFVSVIGEVVAVTSSSFSIAAADSSLLVYIDSDTGIDLSGVQVGDIYKAAGACVNYNGLIEIKARRQGDLVEDPLGDTVPVIDQINCANWVPMAADPIVVSAEIVDDSAVSYATLYYRDSDGEVGGSWNPLAMSNTGGDTYTGTIPGGHMDSQVDFYIKAVDDAAQVTTNPGAAPDVFYSVAVGITPIYDMQYAHPDSSNQAGAYNGKFLNIRGIVIAGTGQVGAPSRFIIQEEEKNPATKSYAYGGAFVYEGTSTYAYYQGDMVEIGGIGNEYNNLTQILPHNANAVNLLSFGNDLPEPSRVTTNELADDSMHEVDGTGRRGEAWESVWVKTFPAAVLDTLGYGDFIISDTNARLDSLVVAPYAGTLLYEPMNGDILKITSYMTYDYGDYVIVPISDANIDVTILTDVDTPTVQKVGGFRSIAPNPFNPVTTIKFAVNSDNLVQLNVYNLRGEKIRTLVQETLPTNEYSFVWDGKSDNGENVSSGQYFARLRIGKEVVQVRKMSLIK